MNPDIYGFKYSDPAFSSSLAVFVNCVSKSLEIAEYPAINETEIKAAINPYSMAVAPDSSCINRFNIPALPFKPTPSWQAVS